MLPSSTLFIVDSLPLQNTLAYSSVVLVTVHGQTLAYRTSLGPSFQCGSGCMHTIMHLLPSVAIQSNLESKTRPKQLLGSLPLVIALPGQCHRGE